MKKAIAMCLIACMVMTGCGGSKGGAGEPQETGELSLRISY